MVGPPDAGNTHIHRNTHGNVDADAEASTKKRKRENKSLRARTACKLNSQAMNQVGIDADPGFQQM